VDASLKLLIKIITLCCSILSILKKERTPPMTFSIPQGLRPFVQTAQAVTAQAGKQAGSLQKTVAQTIHNTNIVPAIIATDEVERQIEIGTHFMPSLLTEKTHPLVAKAQQWTGSIVSKATKSWKA
jgi:hypothetical protein